jgi:hypothetical protein
MSEHLTPIFTDRGFRHLPPIPGAYGGAAQAYESSAASGPHVWLQVVVPADLNSPNGPTVDATLHLTAENAVHLAEQLQHLVANHYQGVS